MKMQRFQLRILQVLLILHINGAVTGVVGERRVKRHLIVILLAQDKKMRSMSPRRELQKPDPSSCTFGFCGKDSSSGQAQGQGQRSDIDPRCLRSLHHDADIRHVYPGETWISSGWKDKRTTWDEPRLCPDLTLVTEYGFLRPDQFFMTCTPAENMDDPDTNSGRKAVTIRTLTRHTLDKLTMEIRGRSKISGYDLEIADRNGTYRVAPFANGFTPQLFIVGGFDLLLDTFDLASPGGPYSKRYRYFDVNMTSPWAVCPWANSSWTRPHECPKGQAICGVTTTLGVTYYGTIRTFAFKCCPVCYPREKWGHIHTVINRSSKPYQHVIDLGPFGITQRSGSVYQNVHQFNFEDYDYDRQSGYIARFAPIFGPRAAQGFNWGWNGTVDVKNSGKNETYWNLRGTLNKHQGANGLDPCPAWSTCRYKQLLGLCGDKVVVITDHFDMDVRPLTFRDLFHCLALSWESFFYLKNTCVAPSLLS